MSQKLCVLYLLSLLLIGCETKEYDQEENATRLPSDFDEYTAVEFDGIGSVYPIDDFSATINWTHEDGISLYYVWDITNGKSERVAVLPAPATSYEMTALGSNQSYTFKVTAQDEEGRAIDNLNEISITTSSKPSVPSFIIRMSPSYKIDVSQTPSFLVGTTRVGDTIKLYSDACVTQVAEKAAEESTTTIAVDPSTQLAAGTYNFSVRIENKNGALSNCSASSLIFSQYTYQPCPQGYIEVPTNSDLGNTPFCVMAYEARAWIDSDGDGVVDSNEADTDGCYEAGCTSSNWGVTTHKPGSGAYGFPWRGLDQRNAKAACLALGDGYDLISNTEWMVIAREAEKTPANWSGGALGEGCLKRGNIGSDDECSYNNFGMDGGVSRTQNPSHTLTNGSVIYDLVGNAAEWIDLGVDEDITLAPLTCEQKWQHVETLDNFCEREFLTLDYQAANSGALTFETYENIYHLNFDSNSKLYLATDGGLAVSENQAGSFTNFSALNGLVTNDLTGGVFTDSNDDIYVGTDKGLHISTNAGKTFSSFRTAAGLASDIVYDVFVKQGLDSSGNTVQIIYAATNAGLSISTDAGANFTNFTTAQGLAHDTSYSVFVDDDQNVYVGTLNGLSISFDDGDSDNTDLSFVSVNASASGVAGGAPWTAGNRVLDVTVDAKGYIYAATTGGLAVSSDDALSFDLIDASDGLGHNLVNSVYVDDNDETDSTDDVLFIATETGLAVSYDNGITINNRLTLNGLLDNTIYDVIERDDIVYVATEKGLSLSYDNGASFTVSKDSSNGLGGQYQVGYGQIFGGVGQGAYRGGSYKSGSYSGVYMMSFEVEPEQNFDDFGFRCVYRP